MTVVKCDKCGKEITSGIVKLLVGVNDCEIIYKEEDLCYSCFVLEVGSENV